MGFNDYMAGRGDAVPSQTNTDYWCGRNDAIAQQHQAAASANSASSSAGSTGYYGGGTSSPSYGGGDLDPLTHAVIFAAMSYGAYLSFRYHLNPITVSVDLYHVIDRWISPIIQFFANAANLNTTHPEAVRYVTIGTEILISFLPIGVAFSASCWSWIAILIYNWFLPNHGLWAQF
jgi:hypothetical protein